MRVKIERITQDECSEGGRRLTIHYSYADSALGRVFIASTSKGVCRMEFTADNDVCLDNLRSVFPRAVYINRRDVIQDKALKALSGINTGDFDICLNISGTDFQIKVWSVLTEIPYGTTVSYADVAARIGNVRACRAVGNAIGSNPVAVVIPCHRVVKSNGDIGGYHWGTERKAALLEWERLQILNDRD